MRGVLLSVAIALFAFTGAAAQPAAPPPDPRQQVLVLVRLPPEHYRPSAAYGAGYGDDISRREQRRSADRIARAHGLTLVDDWPMPLLGLDCFVMAAPPSLSAEEAAAQLSRDPGIAWSEPMHMYQAEGKAAGYNDPLFRTEPTAREWRLADLHRVATGRNISVAVIDSEVEANHPDLAGQVAVSENFTPAPPPKGGERHGTGIAGVIAAKADNGVGVVGVAPQARLMALRACWELRPTDTVCDSVSLAKAMHFAIERRAQVINMSLAGPPDMLLGKLVDVATARGITVVAAYDPRLPHGGFPASHQGVIPVTDESLAVMQPGVYSAPGHDVPTTQPGGRWSLVDGSSYAAAQVSGLMALARQRAAASGGAFTLVSIRPGGGAIDACVTVSRSRRTCAAAASGENLASLRPSVASQR